MTQNVNYLLLVSLDSFSDPYVRLILISQNINIQLASSIMSYETEILCLLQIQLLHVRHRLTCILDKKELTLTVKI